MNKQTETRTDSANGWLMRPNGGKDIIHRDQVHGDVQYDRLSVALLNTNAMQRLGRVYQLGYAHLVFRGGTHTRLSHVMGAAHMAGKIADDLRVNYKQKRAARPLHVAEPLDFLPCRKAPIADRWEMLRHFVSWAALLHDLGHVPLGHTLEDEFEGIFKKHDDFGSPRAPHLWNEKSEVYSILTNSSLYPDSFLRCQIDPMKVWQAVMLICFFKDAPSELQEKCCDFEQFLDHCVEDADKDIRKETTLGNSNEIVLELENKKKFILLLARATRSTKDLFRPFMTDIVANTICADYLDYVRRDPLNVGLDVLRDDRILSHFYVSTDSTGLRMALALLDRHGKPRLDVCTGVVEQVRQRYRFAESIYYHKTKVSASAMFAKAMVLIGQPKEIGREQTFLFEEGTRLEAIARGLVQNPNKLTDLKERFLPTALLHPEIGDDSLHLFLMQRAAENIADLLQKKKPKAIDRGVDGPTSPRKTSLQKVHSQLRGIALLQGISRRHLYKVSLSINAAQFGKLTMGASEAGVVETRLKAALKRLRTEKELRDRVELALADAAGWPADSILLYVPPRKSQAKGIETFAFDESGVVRLNEHHAVSEKVNELGRDYQDLWRILVVTHPMYQSNAIELSEAADVLATELWSNFGEAKADVDLHGEEFVAMMREIAWFPYIRKDHRGAAVHVRDLTIGLPTTALLDWGLFERTPILTTSTEDTLTPVQYAERALLLQLLISKHMMTEKDAIQKIQGAFPFPHYIIQPKNSKDVDIRWRATLDSGNSYSEAQKIELRKAFLLEEVSDELARPLKRPKITRRATRRPKISDGWHRRRYGAIQPTISQSKKKKVNRDSRVARSE